MNWREKTEKEKQPEYLFVPSRHIFFDNIREIDKLYIVGCADAGSEIWDRGNYYTDEQFLAIMLVLAQSPYADKYQRAAAANIIRNMKGQNAQKAKRVLCKRRRQEFSRKRDSIKLALIDRDGYKCAQCGTQKDLAIDHIAPLSRGGTDNLKNLQFLCRSCN